MYKVSMRHKWSMLVIVWLMYISVAYSAVPSMILGIAVEGRGPVGECASFQMVRDGGVELNITTQSVDLEIDTINNIVYAGMNYSPLQGGAPINNLFRINSLTMAMLTQVPVMIQGDLGLQFCDIAIPPDNYCVLPTSVRYDATNGYVYVGGFSGVSSLQALAVVDPTTLAIGVINTYTADTAIAATTLAFHDSVAWYGMGFTKISGTPSTYAQYRITRGALGTTAQGPVNQNMTGAFDLVLAGNFQIDTGSSLLYLADYELFASTLHLRAYNFSLVDQGGVVDVADTIVNNGLLYISSTNELVVCTTGGIRVYSVFPFVLKRSAAIGCALPVYDYINNKLYTMLGTTMTRFNYTTLAVDATQVFAGLNANGRFVMDVGRQFLYGIEHGGPTSVGTAVAKYDVCASI